MAEKVALNYALMIEQVKSRGYSNEEILEALNKGNIDFFREFGKGLPDWETLFSYFHDKKEKVEQLLRGNYEIAFLTKGTLKRYLLFKFGLAEGKDFKDKGEVLGVFMLSREDYQALSKNIAKNWIITNVEEDKNNVQFTIELQFKPVL
ncbi:MULTISPECIES: hypothetical protein [unclassified Niallia]|uniref:hypothetical protein n=1 Tax=unclassified Niallia TaxID=2837522 RepID=UPI001EDA2635|nr:MULTISPECIES: hypothetical protein [unclassified Niallia]MCM3031994.1 hypothetical protein [Niallia sp. MER 6]MDL0436001.1 hypothetical protein [Niallia sp. SS-2023]UPO87868.1 hypothetical protein L8T27_001205 [Niallia sp. Man26]